MGKPNSCPLTNNKKKKSFSLAINLGPDRLWCPSQRAESDFWVLVTLSPTQWTGGKSFAFQEKEISKAACNVNALRLDFVTVSLHWKFRKRHDFQHAALEFLKWNLFCVMPVQREKWQLLTGAALQSARPWADHAGSRDRRCFRPLFFQVPTR